MLACSIYRRSNPFNSLIGITQHVPWAAKIMRNLPLVNNGMARFIKFAMNKAYTRYNMEMKRKDLFYHMVNKIQPSHS